MPESIHDLPKRISIQDSNPHTRSQHPFTTMEFCDGFPAAAADGNRFVAATDAGILMKLNHSDRNGERSLCNHAGDRSLNTRHRDRLDDIVRIVLPGTVVRYCCQLTTGHGAMQPQTNHHRPRCCHALPKRIER